MDKVYPLNLYNTKIQAMEDLMASALMIRYDFFPKVPMINIATRSTMPICWPAYDLEIPTAISPMDVKSYRLDPLYIESTIAETVLRNASVPAIDVVAEDAYRAARKFELAIEAKLQDSIFAAMVSEPIKRELPHAAARELSCHLDRLMSSSMYGITGKRFEREYCGSFDISRTERDETVRTIGRHEYPAELPRWRNFARPARHDDQVMAMQFAMNTYLDSRSRIDPYVPPWIGPHEYQEFSGYKSPVRIEAEAKGDLLLKDVLGESSFSHFKSVGYVDVTSVKDSTVGYRIRGAGRMIGLLRRENGVWVEDNKSLCIHPKNAHAFVPGDQISSQILLCKYDEGLLWSTANLHERRAA